MPLLTLSAKLDRTDSSTPWGFRLQGGKDFSAPLAIQRVTPGSLADKCGIHQGDVVVKICGHDARSFRHSDAHGYIQNAGNSLDLSLERGAGAGSSYGYSSATYSPSQPTYQPSQPTYQPASQPAYKPTINPSPRPFGASPGVPVVVNKQYNTPINVYSVDNVMDSLAGQTRAMGISDQQSAGPPWRSSQPSKQGGSAPQAAPFRPAAPARGPVAAPQPVRVEMWKPSIPTGPRNPTFGKRGDARSMTAPLPGRIPVCNGCGATIRGPFVLALDTTWCPDHFICANPNCNASLVETGFVEEGGKLYCENDYAQHFAPTCAKCSQKIIGDAVNALQQNFHPHCFVCVHCRQPIGKGSFHMEDGQPYCDKDWQAMYQTKCYGCQFPVEPGDRWVEALNANWHSECFNCSTCQVNLEGQPFYAKGGRPYCKRHASGGK